MAPRQAGAVERTPLLHEIGAAFGDVIDYELLEGEHLSSRTKYEELARGYKAVADEAWIRYRQATDLWQFCRAKARSQTPSATSSEDAAAFAAALRLR
jgi:ureidoglycolate hydrolase